MIRWFTRILPFAAALAVAEGIYSRGDFWRLKSVFLGSLAVFLGLLLVSVGVLLPRRVRLAARLAILAALALLSAVPAYAVGRFVFRRDLAEAKSYAESFVRELDGEKEREGKYPRTLESRVPGSRKVPRLLTGCPKCFYSSDGTTFRSEERRVGREWQC